MFSTIISSVKPVYQPALSASFVPIFKSDGEFQINPEKFKEYLPKDYKNDFSSQVEAVYNFVKKNSSLQDIEQLYTLYNSGSTSRKLDGHKIDIVKKLYKKVSAIK